MINESDVCNYIMTIPSPFMKVKKLLFGLKIIPSGLIKRHLVRELRSKDGAITIHYRNHLLATEMFKV